MMSLKPNNLGYPYNNNFHKTVHTLYFTFMAITLSSSSNWYLQLTTEKVTKILFWLINAEGNFLFRAKQVLYKYCLINKEFITAKRQVR